MAKMIPSWIMSDSPPGEKSVFAALRDDPTTEDWIVLHSFTLSKHVKQEKGEIDFLIFAPGLGALVVEVKSHLSASRRDGMWYLGSDPATSRSPFEQAENNRYSLKKSIENRGWNSPPLRSVVIFTGCSFAESSSEWLPWQCINKTQIGIHGVAGMLRSSFEGMRKHYSETSSWRSLEFSVEDAQKLSGHLRGDFEVSESLSSISKDRYEEYRIFIDEQYEALDQLEENSRMIFDGAAGTGKTLLALETARRSVESGKKIILLCRNRYLGNYLNKVLGEHKNIVFCGTYHALMMKITGQTSVSDETWFDDGLPREAVNKLINEPNALTEFDTMIIDEGQDFSDGIVLDFLETLVLLNPEAELRFFGDFENQNVFFQSVGTKKLITERFEGCRSFKLWTNCRNREGIGEVIESLGEKLDVYRRFRLKGRTNCVQYSYMNSEEQRIELLEEVLSDLMKSFPLGEIVVLGVNFQIDPKSFSQSTRDRFHVFEPENFTERKKMLSTTVRKFKGLEAQAVVIHDFSVNDDLDLIYTGISRAIEKLVIVAPRGEQMDILEKVASTIDVGITK